MSYPDHPPPRPPPFPYMLPPHPSGNVGGFWPQNSVGMEHLESQARFEDAPAIKRPRHAANPASLLPNPRTNHPHPSGNRGTSNLFFKTRMCAKFLDGTCRSGENCTFAHGVEDMREPPPNWQEIVREKDREAGNWNDDQRIIHRMKICRKFYNGEECPYGEKCNFLHESPSRFKTDVTVPLSRDSSAISIGTMGPPLLEHRDDEQTEFNKQLNANWDASRANNMKSWKTKMCHKWEITGQCPFGDKCHFAHGQSELKVSGGHNEAEMMTNLHSFPTNALPHHVNDASRAETVVGLPIQEGVNNRASLKWKLHRKITTIYGDWPEDLIPPENLSNSTTV